MDKNENYDIKKDEKIKIEEKYGNYFWGRLDSTMDI